MAGRAFRFGSEPPAGGKQRLGPAYALLTIVLVSSLLASLITAAPPVEVPAPVRPPETGAGLMVGGGLLVPPSAFAVIWGARGVAAGEGGGGPLLAGGLVGAGVSLSLLTAGALRRRRTASWYGDRPVVKRYSGAGLLVGGSAALVWSGALASTVIWAPPMDPSDRMISYAACGVGAAAGIGMLIGGTLVRTRWLADGAKLSVGGGPTVDGGGITISGRF